MAFLSDSGAYFAGRFFGRHKLAPVISPNKTIEGVVGGVFGATVGMVLYALVLDIFFKDIQVSYGYAVLYGIFAHAYSLSIEALAKAFQSRGISI